MPQHAAGVQATQLDLLASPILKPIVPSTDKKSDLLRLAFLALLTVASGAAAGVFETLHLHSLLPWVCVSAVAVGSTFARPRGVDLFEPFTFLSWTHYAPVFVVGAFLLAVGVVGYPFPGLVRDPMAACALSLVYVVAGYLALGLGCRSRAAASLGGRLAPAAPAADRTIPFAAILLVSALGLAASYGAFRSGIIGYAIPRASGPFDAATSYAATLLSLGHFLFWFRWFDSRQKRLPRAALVVPILIVGASMVVWGNRGILLSCFLVAAFAFRLTRERLTVPQNAAVVALAFVALFLGMAYGSLFRRLKGGETGARKASPPPASTAPESRPPSPAPAPPSQPSLDRQLSVAAETVATFAQQPQPGRVRALLLGVGQRLNLLSDVSVTIARYRALKPLEASHGISGIWTMTWTGFVPRAIWPGKPRVSDARAYADLYFGWGGNSYATSPPADLIRNFGPFAMPAGMALLGLVLGILRAALAAGGQAPDGERAALFAMLVLSLNLEGSYGLLLPTMLRVALVTVMGLGVVRLWRLPGVVTALRRRPGLPEPRL